MNILVINGPNLDMLGKREPEKYGDQTLESLEELLRNTYPDHSFTFFQSNHEGAIIEEIHKFVTYSDIDGAMANFGGFTHTSVAIRDALHMLNIPKVEIHITNIHAREAFRHKSITAGACNGVIAGFGFNSYILGVKALELLHKDQ